MDNGISIPRLNVRFSAVRRAVVVAAFIGAQLVVAAPSVAQQPAKDAKPTGRLLSLHDACVAGDLDRVKQLVDTGININAPSVVENETPLITALKSNQPDIVNYLLDNGADPKIEGPVGETTLSHAAYWGMTEIGKRLMDMGVDRQHVDGIARTPLHYAAERNHVEIARVLTPTPASINAVDSFGNAPLDLAIAKASQDMVLALLDAGARFSVDNDRTMTRIDTCVKKRWFDAVDRALNQAARAPKFRQTIADRAYNTAFSLGDVEMLKHLTGLGANANTANMTGDSRLFQAADRSGLDMVDMLLESGANPKEAQPMSKWTPLHAAALHQSLDIVKRLLEKGADPNAPDSIGRTPLHIAALSGSNAVVMALLAAGADATRIDVLGDSTLHYAAMSGSVAVTRTLLKAKAPQPKNKNGQTPFDIAGETDELGMGAKPDVQALLKSPSTIVPPGYEELIAVLAGSTAPDVVAQTRDRWSSLATNGIPLIHIAIFARSLPGVQSVLNRDAAALNARDPSGLQPIHVAAECADTAILSELITRGAAVNSQDNLAKWSPLHCAAAAGNTPAIKLLLEKGANPKAVDARGKSPKAIAQFLEKPLVVSALP